MGEFLAEATLLRGLGGGVLSWQIANLREPGVLCPIKVVIAETMLWPLPKDDDRVLGQVWGVA